jgi:hypothetical protein
VVDYDCRHIRVDYGCSQVIRKKNILPLRPPRKQRGRLSKRQSRKLLIRRLRRFSQRKKVDRKSLARKRPAVGGLRRSTRPASSNLRSSAKSADQLSAAFLVLTLCASVAKLLPRSSRRRLPSRTTLAAVVRRAPLKTKNPRLAPCGSQSKRPTGADHFERRVSGEPAAGLCRLTRRSRRGVCRRCLRIAPARRPSRPWPIALHRLRPRCWRRPLGCGLPCGGPSSGRASRRR